MALASSATVGVIASDSPLRKTWDSYCQGVAVVAVQTVGHGAWVTRVRGTAGCEAPCGCRGVTKGDNDTAREWERKRERKRDTLELLLCR